MASWAGCCNMAILGTTLAARCLLTDTSASSSTSSLSGSLGGSGPPAVNHGSLPSSSSSSVSISFAAWILTLLFFTGFFFTPLLSLRSENMAEVAMANVLGGASCACDCGLAENCWAAAWNGLTSAPDAIPTVGFTDATTAGAALRFGSREHHAICTMWPGAKCLTDNLARVASSCQRMQKRKESRGITREKNESREINELHPEWKYSLCSCTTIPNKPIYHV